MKKGFSVYGIIWAICLAVFNVIVFVTPNEVAGVSKFTSTFWVGYAFITVAFLDQLACAFLSFRKENLQKLFYNIPLIPISYGGLIVMLVAGSIFMAIPVLPEWIGIIICIIILAFNAIAILKAAAAANIVAGIDDKIKAKTFFIKSLSVDAEVLMNSMNEDGLRTEAKRVYEAIRYSEPTSTDALSKLDSQIQCQFNAFSDAAKSGDVELSRENADALIVLIESRNKKCKLLK